MSPANDPSAAPPGGAGGGPATRRTFLRWVSAIGGAVVGSLTLVPALRAFVAPLMTPRAARNWVRLGEASEFDLDIPVKVDFVQTVRDAWIENRALHNVWVYTEDGEAFTVYNGRCPHLGCGFSLDEGAKEFHCPCHHGRFDLKTGAVKGGPPPRPLDVMDSKVERGILYVAYEDYRVGVPQKISLG